mgnify:CR=1 FL=1
MRVSLLKSASFIPLSHSLPDFSAYPHPVPYPQPHSKQAAAAEPRSAAEPAHSGFLESPDPRGYRYPYPFHGQWKNPRHSRYRKSDPKHISIRSISL